jgi:hypothetical protein
MELNTARSLPFSLSNETEFAMIIAVSTICTGMLQMKLSSGLVVNQVILVIIVL